MPFQSASRGDAYPSHAVKAKSCTSSCATRWMTPAALSAGGEVSTPTDPKVYPRGTVMAAR